MDNKKYPETVDKIKDFVVRPTESVDDITNSGSGKYSVSPLAFPNVNISGDSNPTRLIPKFKVSYKDPKIYSGENNYEENSEIGIIRKNFTYGSTINSINLDPDASNVDDFYNYFTIRIIDGTGKGQKRNIVDYIGSTREAIVDVNWTTQPDTSSVFLILVREEIAQGGTSNTIILDSNASSIDGFYDSIIVTSGDETQIVRRLIRIIEGTGIGQVRFAVTTPPGDTYDGTTKVLTISEDWDTIPDNTSKFIILQTHPYKWDGTEGDNKFGTYLDEYNDPIIDPNTNEPINHLRNGFSSEEVVGFLRDKLSASITMGKYNGTLSKWLFGGMSSVNIGGAGSREVFIDTFSINKNSRINRTYGATNPENELLVEEKKKKLKRHKRYTRWLLSNTNYDNLSSSSKSPFVKNYPYVYNSENPVIEGTSQSGTANEIVLENSQNTKTQNDYYVNSIIEIISGTGTGQKAYITAYDGGTLTASIDLFEDSGVLIEDSNPSTPWNVIPDNTSEYKLYVIKEAGHLDNSADSDNYRIQLNSTSTPDLRPFTDDMLYYMKDNSYHNNITLDLSNNNMYGRHHISLLHKLYMADVGTNQTILTELDSMYASGVPSPTTDPHILRRVPDSGLESIDDDNDLVTDRNIVKYLYKKRKKYTITNLVTTPNVPLSNELQYTDGVNEVTIHLIPNTNDLDVVISHPSKSASDIRNDILENNNLVPDLILPDYPNDSLEVLFVANDSTDQSDIFFEQERQRSKKTFIHLPTSNIEDGSIMELDISLPKEPDSPSFVENTLGVLSGYKNYITQPRVYVFSGYQAQVGNICNFDVGLTETKNPYLFSPMPEVEYSTPGNDSYESNIFHQRKMDVNDINGNKYIRIISFPDTYTAEVTEAIGKYVIGNTSQNKGVLLNFDNDNRVWAVRLLDLNNEFLTNEIFTVEDGTGQGDGIVKSPTEIDARTLLAVVYPSSTNTFGWRIDKDPQFKLMNWAIIANSEYLGSSTYRAFERNRNDILDYSNIFNMGLSTFPISYKNGLFGYSDYSRYLSGCVRTYLQDNLNPNFSGEITSGDNLQYASVVKQASKSHVELIRDFEKSRMRYNLRNDMSQFSDLGLRVAFNNSNITGIPDGYFDGIELFNNFEIPSNQNFDRWMVKPKDIPEYIVKATGNPEPLEYETIESSIDPFSASFFLRNYISTFSIPGKQRNSDAGDLYIPGTLYPNTNPSYEYGQGISNILTTYLLNEGIDLKIVNDFRRRLWESSHEIEFYTESHPGFRRKFDFYEFDGEDVNDESYFREFYGMLYDPFSRVFSLNSVNPNESSIDLISDLSTIQSIGFEAAESTLLNALKSNPISEKYYRLSKSIVPQELTMSKMVGIHDYISDLNDDTNQFIRNYITCYSNNLTTRFYNSYRIALTGDENSTSHDSNNGNIENYDTDRTYTSSMYQYFTNVVSSVDRARSIDDDYAFFYSAGDIKAEDLNSSWTFFDKGHGFRGLNAITYAQGATSNTITLDVSASSENDFYTGNLISITSGSGIGQTKTIIEYDGTTKVATVDSIWSTVPDNSSSFEIKTHLKNLITTNGQQYRFKKGFYDSKGDTSYIKVKMKFIFSKKVGRWLTLDYRQYPMTYLTPTFGNEALSYKEKSIVFEGRDGKSIKDYVPVLDLDYSTNLIVSRTEDKKSLQFSGGNGSFESNFFDSIKIYIFKLMAGVFDYENYMINTIKYTTVTNEAIAPIWDSNVTYFNGNYVQYEGIVYQIQNGPVSGGNVPKYNVVNFAFQEPKPIFAPIWNVNNSINSGEYVTYNQSVYQALSSVLSNEQPPNANTKFQLVDSFSIVPTIWLSGSFYAKGSIVEYNGIIYEALNNINISLLTPNIDSNFAVYVKYNKYALEWNHVDLFKANSYVKYDDIFYRVLVDTQGTPSPNINSSYEKITYMSTPGVGWYVFNWLMQDTIPDNLSGFVHMTTTKNSIDEETYPKNMSNLETITDYLWKQECLPTFDTPYYKMTPMEINRFCVPFLSKKLPYENNGILKEFAKKWKTSDVELSQPFLLSEFVFEDHSLDYFDATAPGDNPPGPYQVHISKSSNPTIEGIWFSSLDYNGISRRDSLGNYTNFDNYSSLAGISTNRAESIDSNTNYVYFASGQIVRFDGSTFEVYNDITAPTSAHTFRYDEVNDIAYVSSFDGFYVSQNSFLTSSPSTTTWTRYYDGNSILPNTGTGDFDFDVNYVWILPSFNVDDNRIFKYDINAPIISSEVVSYNGIDHVKKNSIRLHPTNGEIYVGGNWEVSTARFSRRLVSGQWIVFDYSEPSVISNPRQLRIDTNGVVFWGTSVGLLQYNFDGNFTKYDRFNGLSFPYNPSSSEIRGFDINISTTNNLIANNIWVGGNGGLVRFKRYDEVEYSDYIPSKLLEPQNDPNDISEAGINFIVPNNVHGGKVDPNRDLFLFQPHLFKVYWHIRPVVSAYAGTDIPSPTGRTGGDISDPCLANMFDFPMLKDNQEFIIPWDKDMSKNWLFDGDTNIEFVISENNVDNNVVISENEDPEQIISEV